MRWKDLVNSEFDKYYEATEPGYRERAIGWATAIGLQDVDGLKPSNYENQKLNVEKTQLPLEEFFKVLLFGYDLELKNRFLRIGQEYGAKKASAISDLHRNAAANDGANDGVNDGVKSTLNGTEEKAVKAILRNGRINAIDLASELGVKKRQAERVIAALKAKAGLKRRGADKNGEWYFESAKGTRHGIQGTD